MPVKLHMLLEATCASGGACAQRIPPMPVEAICASEGACAS